MRPNCSGPLRAELRQRLDEADAALQRAVTNRLARAEQALKENETALRWFSPEAPIWPVLSNARQGLPPVLSGRPHTGWTQKNRLGSALNNPDAAASTQKIWPCSNARLDVLTSALPATLLRRIMDADHRLALAHTRLHATIRELLTDRERVLENLDLALEVGNPLAPLRRGYALVRTRQGNILRSVDEALPGQHIEVRLNDGRVNAVVSTVKPEKRTLLDQQDDSL